MKELDSFFICYSCKQPMLSGLKDGLSQSCIGCPSCNDMFYRDDHSGCPICGSPYFVIFDNSHHHVFCSNFSCPSYRVSNQKFQSQVFYSNALLFTVRKNSLTVNFRNYEYVPNIIRKFCVQLKKHFKIYL